MCPTRSVGSPPTTRWRAPCSSRSRSFPLRSRRASANGSPERRATHTRSAWPRPIASCMTTSWAATSRRRGSRSGCGSCPTAPPGTPIPSFMAKSPTTAYYQGGSLQAGRPGYFFVNTYDLKSRPKWEMEALSLHEAVPAPHLQIALARELDGLPEFRRYGGYTAFVEGWGLYAEGLGPELGMYQDPYSKFGQLTYEMWRAVRLVLDTGLHAMGWTRQQAIDFFKDNAPKAEQDIIVEVDRYIVNPGQALAYKIGQLKFRELRDSAAAALGPRFDIRAFHDEVLRNGGLPMDLLEQDVRAWIGKQR